MIFWCCSLNFSAWCWYSVIMVWVNIVRSRYIINVVLDITCNNNIVLNYLIINPDLWWYWLLPISGGDQTVNNRSAEVIWEIVCKNVVYYNFIFAMRQLSSICYQEPSWHIHLTISSSSALIDKLVSTFQHQPAGRVGSSCPAFQTDLIITSLAQIDVLMSMMLVMVISTRLPHPDDWSLGLHCYIRQLNNWCNNRHTVFVSTKY